LPASSYRSEEIRYGQAGEQEHQKHDDGSQRSCLETARAEMTLGAEHEQAQQTEETAHPHAKLFIQAAEGAAQQDGTAISQDRRYW
jgi:hypothetical protein